MAESKTKSAVKTADKQMSTKGLDKIIGGIIFLIFFLSPLFFSGFVAQGIGFEKMTLFFFLVLLGVVAWVTKGVIQGELNLKRTPFDLPILGLLVVYTISTFMSVSTKDSLIGSYGNSSKGLIAIIVFVLFYYLLINNINQKRIKLLFWGLVASGSLTIILSLLQLFEIFLLPMSITQRASFNPIGSLTSLTMYIVMLIPLMIIAVAQVKSIHPKLNKALGVGIKAVLGAVGIGGLVILALLNGFTFWPAAIFGIVIVLMFYLSKIIPISSNNLVIPLVGFLMLIILLVLGNFDIKNHNLPAEVSLSRGASWDIAKNSLKEDPFFGSGPSTFFYTFTQYKSKNFNNSPLWNIRFDSASGIMNELFATVGALGALMVIILALLAVSLSFLSLIKTKEKEVHSILLALFAAYVSALILCSLFAINNSIILITVLFSVFLIATALSIYPEKFKDLKLSFRASAKYALALAAIFLFVSAGVVVLFTMGLKLYLADVYARQALQVQGAKKKIEKLDKAIQLVPYQDIYFLNLSSNYMSLANQEAISGKDQAKVQEYLSLAISNGRKSVDISPNKASNNESLALIYENASFYTRGALEWSEEFYNDVIKLDPNNPTPYLRIALVNMARANVETDKGEKDFFINEAIKKYDEAVKQKQDLAAAYYGKAIAYEKLENLDDAIDQLRQATLIARNNNDYIFELGRLYFNRGVSNPNLKQTETKKITETEIIPLEEEETDVLDEEKLAEGDEEDVTEEVVEPISIQKNEPTGNVIERNNDLNLAEQIFGSLVIANPKHANALYSLAVLYQKLGETDKTTEMVSKLLSILKDDRSRQIVMQQFEGLY